MASRLSLLLVTLVAFVVRFLRIGVLENDHYPSLVRAHQVLQGAWPVRDFADPGLPLGYLLSAAAALLGGPTLLTEAILSCALFAAAIGVTFTLARRASGSIALALALMALLLLVPPRLYNSSKVLVPVVAMLLAWRYADTPTAARIVALGVWTGVGFLFRHDYAAYTGGASLVMLAVRHADTPGLLVRRFTAYVGGVAVVAAPWLVYVQAQQGLWAYFASAIRFSAAEGKRTMAPWAGSYYAAVAVPLVTLLVARRGTRLVASAHVAFACTLVLLANVVLLRDEPAARLPDVHASTAVLIAVGAGRFITPATVHIVDIGIAAGGLALAAGLALLKPAVAVPTALIDRWQLVATRLHDARPEITPSPDRDTLVQYLARCTADHERLLIGGFAPEVPVLTKRAFAGGVPVWLPGYYTSPDDIARARAQLAREQVGAVVLVNEREHFETSWPLLAADLRQRRLTRHALTLPSERVELWIPERRRLDAETGLPCR